MNAPYGSSGSSASRSTHRVMASASPDSAASHLRRKSRIWLPSALSCSLGSPCAAYASMNSYASSMALQREASASRASSPGDGDDAFGDDEVMSLVRFGWTAASLKHASARV